ncbi:MAG: hypothetical protein ACTSWX_04975 [Promethearchaeota archaeon]
MGLIKSYHETKIFFDLDNEKVFINYKSHLNDKIMKSFVEQNRLKPGIIELKNKKDKLGNTQHQLEKILAFL